MSSRSLVGLDIGSRVIKALQLTETGDHLAITEYGTAEISPERSLLDVVSDLFDRKRFRTRRVATAVSGRGVFVRYVSMPAMSEPELVNAARYEMGKYLPVEADEVVHDAQRLEEPEAPAGDPEPEMKVLLVAAKRNHVDTHLAVLEQVGLVPHVLDVDSFALGNAYELSARANPQAVASGKLVALVDIGASKTNINVVDGRRSFFTREFYKGGNDVTEAICRKLSMEPRQAEDFKQSGDPRVTELTASAIDDICHDVLLSLDYFENQYDRRVEDLLVAGGGSMTAGLLETLGRTVQKPVASWDPAKHLPSELPEDSLGELEASAGQSTIALGLASRMVMD